MQSVLNTRRYFAPQLAFTAGMLICVSFLTRPPLCVVSRYLLLVCRLPLLCPPFPSELRGLFKYIDSLGDNDGEVSIHELLDFIGQSIPKDQLDAWERSKRMN